MSNANVLLAKGLYAAFKRGEIATILAALTDDADWQIHGRRGLSHHRSVQGTKGSRGVLRPCRRAPGEHRVRAARVPCRRRQGIRARPPWLEGAQDWKAGERRMCHIFTFRNGKVCEFREFTDTAQFAEAYRN